MSNVCAFCSRRAYACRLTPPEWEELEPGRMACPSCFRILREQRCEKGLEPYDCGTCPRCAPKRPKRVLAARIQPLPPDHPGYPARVDDVVERAREIEGRPVEPCTVEVESPMFCTCGGPIPSGLCPEHGHGEPELPSCTCVRGCDGPDPSCPEHGEPEPPRIDMPPLDGSEEPEDTVLSDRMLNHLAGQPEDAALALGWWARLIRGGC